MNDFIIAVIKKIRRVFVAAVGFIVLLIGLFMIVLPGPAFVFIPLGLGILATEFLWARGLLKKLRARFKMPGKGGLYGKKTE